MNQYRFVKLIYAFTFTIFSYVLWVIALAGFFKMNGDYKIFLIAFLEIIIFYYIIDKKYNKRYILSIPIIMAFIGLCSFLGFSAALINMIYMSINIIIISKLEGEKADYKYYSGKIKIYIYILIALGIFVIFLDSDIKTHILRFYIIFLISSTWFLREIRRYSFKINTKRKLRNDIIIGLFMLSLTLDMVSNLIIYILKSVIYIVDFALEKIILFVIYMLSEPLGVIINWLSKVYSKFINNPAVKINVYTPKEEVTSIAEEIQYVLPSYAITSIKIIFGAIIIFIIYKTSKAFKYTKNKDDGYKDEKREKIKKEKTLKKPKLFEKIVDIFAVKDYRMQILKMYEGYEKHTYNKKIFKKHMTATQLYNVVRTLLVEQEAAKAITEIYNEAKFSKHDINANNVKEAEANCNKVKREL
jgi:hypothetical protein